MIFYNMQKETVHHFYLMYSFFFLLLHNYLRFLRKSGIWISRSCTRLSGILTDDPGCAAGLALGAAAEGVVLWKGRVLEVLLSLFVKLKSGTELLVLEEVFSG